MSEETITKIFKLLNEKFNKEGLFYFKIINLKNIKAYFKDGDTEFATFYVDTIIDYLEEREDDE